MSISQLLADLGGDGGKVDRMRKDPDSILKDYNLTPEIESALRESLEKDDAKPLQDALAAHDGDQYDSVVINIIR